MPGSSSAIKAGEAYVELTMQDKTGNGLSRVQAGLSSFGRQIAILGAGISGASASILGPLQLAVNSASDAFETLNKFRAVFGDLADRYRDRAGGYTRVLKLGNRVGDAAPVSLVELVGAPARKGAAPASKPGDKAAKKAARSEQKTARKAEKKAAAAGKAAGDKAAAKKGGRGGRPPATRGRGASRESS